MGKAAFKRSRSAGGTQQTVLQRKYMIEKKSRRAQKRQNNEQRSLQARGLKKKINLKQRALPDLQRFKKKIVDKLKGKKCSETLRKAITQLQQHQQHHIEDFTDKPDQQVPEELEEDNNIKVNIRQGKKYFKEIKKVIETCDIIVEILDARDPMACRCRNIEQKILAMEGDKKIILLLNKIDLIPVENAHLWQNHLRREYPTVLFKANLQNQQTHLSSNVLFKKSMIDQSGVAEEMIKSSKSVGPDHLVQLIKQLSKVEGTNRAVTVGLIGYPNVGKSSVINSLKRMKTCQVSSIAGSTKCLQQVKLDKQVKLLDCPGVIFEMQDKTNLILRNTLKLDDDLEEIVQAILDKVSHRELEELYKIEPFKDTDDFLAKVARSTGKLIKGGIPDFKKASKKVVEDWNRGNIKYFTLPPGTMDIQS